MKRMHSLSPEESAAIAEGERECEGEGREWLWRRRSQVGSRARNKSVVSGVVRGVRERGARCVVRGVWWVRPGVREGARCMRRAREGRPGREARREAKARQSKAHDQVVL